MKTPFVPTSSLSTEPPLAESETFLPGITLPPPIGQARRSFLRSLGMASALLPVAGLSGASHARGDDGHNPFHGNNGRNLGHFSRGDAAILRFLAAAELIETDLWQQYTEITLGNAAFANALTQLDSDMPQYVADNTDDELSHATFLNAILAAIGNRPVNLDAFRTLPSSSATGARNTGRLTSLANLTVDTSWYLRYRATGNPDLGAAFPQFITIVNRPAIPAHDLPDGSDELQAIANTAGFHFATIEQGGSSLYGSFVPKATNPNVLRILYAIGGSEVIHFAIWHDKAGNAPRVSVPGVTFPDLSTFDGDESRQTNLIMPEPCSFISANLPPCAVVRPTLTQNAGAKAAVAALTASGLFNGQSAAFFSLLNSLADQADDAQHEGFF